MATSGNKVYTVTTQQIIKDAFVEATIYRENAALPTEDYNSALRKLNTLVKGWQAMGYNIWNDRRATLFLQYGTAKYTFPTGNATESFVETTTSVAALASANTITLDSIAGITAADFIGIVLDDGTVQWTTVVSILGTTVTLTDLLTDDVASGNVVFAYTTKITKPLSVKEVMLHQNSSNEIEMYRSSRSEYFLLSNKASIGNPNQYYYERKRTSGDLYIWSTPSDVTQYINLTYQPYLDNFEAQANEADLPIEWQRAIVLGLASELCLPFGIGQETYQKVTSKAKYWLDMAKGNDSENGTLTLDTSELWHR